MNASFLNLSSLWLFAITTIFSSCQKDDNELLPSDPVSIKLTSQQIAIIESENNFAFEIFSRVLEKSGASDNVIISPLSISYALAMTLNGASGNTREAMLEAMKIEGFTPEVINISYKNLTEALLNVDKRVIVSIANSVWTENDFAVKKTFIDILTDYYSSESKSFDINDVSAPVKINNWIKDKTNGLITDMVDKLNDNTVMLLINAIYFKGKWKSQFDKAKTVKSPFYKPDGTTQEVDMMKQIAVFKVLDGERFYMAEFPYGQGNYVMNVILPKEGSDFNVIIPFLTDLNFNNWLSQLTRRETDLSFPRFKYGYKKQLKDILTDMGMGIAFGDDADLSNISEMDLLINDITHQAFIETNEEGTEAAAATIVDIGVTSVPIRFILNFDRSFLYIIREITTNSIIFMGRVADPKAG